MPYNSDLRREKAGTQKRDAHGHFIPANSTIKSSQKSSGAGNFIGSLFKAEKGEDDESLINVKVANPLAKITKLLKDIKSHQSTTVSMRFTIPLIALPVVFILAFQLGRGQSSCHEYQASLIGTLKTIEIMRQPEENFFTQIIGFLPFWDNQSKITDQSILILGNEEVITIENPTAVNLRDFSNAIVSGKYSGCNKTIILEDKQNIQNTPL